MALTHSVEKAYDINKYNVNNFWRVAIEKELKKIRGMETFEIMEGLKQENIQTPGKNNQHFTVYSTHSKIKDTFM